jgi:dTDP-glucose pyrophosphorylase/CBS domain-containing protein
MGTVDSYLIRPTDSLRRAAEIIDQNKSGIAVAVDSAGHLVGTITDGDLRRAVLNRKSLDASIEELMTSRSSSPVTASVGCDKHTLLGIMQSNHVRHLPLLDAQDRVVDIALLSQLLETPYLAVTAVVMAGGFGTRLRPLTDTVPKPLLPVGGTPLIEMMVDQLVAAGVKRFVVTTHYLAERIEEHLGDGISRQVSIDYVHEVTPLGTAGALSLIEKPSEPILVVNCDILTRLDYSLLIAFHHEVGAKMTVAAREYHIQVPYGVLKTEGTRLHGIIEKPDYRFLFAAGVYVLQPEVLDHLVRGETCDMPVLISRLLANGVELATFPVREYWLDIGHLDSYAQAQSDHAEGALK